MMHLYLFFFFFFTSPLGSICQNLPRSYPLGWLGWGKSGYLVPLSCCRYTRAPRETSLPLISLRTSGNYNFSAVGCRQKSAKFLTGFIFLCCLAMLLWAVCNPSPTPCISAHRKQKDVSQQNPFPRWDPRGRSKHPCLLPATEDLLIPSSGCGRAAGSRSVAAVSSGVRSWAHFTCDWVRISICFASTPRLSLLPSLFTCSVSRHPASALWHADARQAAM